MSAHRTHRGSRLALSAACVLLVASPLAAGDSRWYVAGKLGRASVSGEFGPRILGWMVDDEDDSAGFELGYDLHRNLALQVGYHDLGTYEGLPTPCPPGEICPLSLVPVHPSEAKFTGYSLSAVPRLAVGERVSVFGKMGVFDWDADLSWPSGPQLGREAADRQLLAGLGGRYVFPSGFGVLVEYERSDLLEGVSVGASWRF